MGIKTAKELLLKTPLEVRKVTADFSGDDVSAGETIATIDDVTISRVDGIAMTGADLTKDSQVSSGLEVQLTLSLGILNVAYEVHVRVTTTLGQTLEMCGKMKIGRC